jgi:hypothetical protein
MTMPSRSTGRRSPVSRDYHAKKATPQDTSGPVSKSLLWQFGKSPWKWAHQVASQPTAAMNLGSVVHAITLEPDKVSEVFVVSEYDSFRTKEAREWRDQKAAEGLIVLSEKDYLAAAAMAHRATEELHRALGGDHVNYFVEQEVTGSINGVDVCGLIDVEVVPTDKAGVTLWDLKTCSSIGDERSLQRTIFDFGYHVQAALYCDLQSADTEFEPTFGFIFVETSVPYETTHIILDRDCILAGRAKYMELINKWAQLRDKPLDEWPGSVERGIVMEPPSWA